MTPFAYLGWQVWRHCYGIQTAGDELPMNCHRIANESAARSAFLVAY
jgi:hypothetical protein